MPHRARVGQDSAHIKLLPIREERDEPLTQPGAGLLMESVAAGGVAAVSPPGVRPPVRHAIRWFSLRLAALLYILPAMPYGPQRDVGPGR